MLNPATISMLGSHRNVALLRSGQLAEVDAENVAEGLESMGKRDLRALSSRLQVLTMHLLKYQYQPGQLSKSWLTTIDHQRDEIDDFLLDSPSLRHAMTAALDALYPKAVRDACREMGLPASTFPDACPYPLDLLIAPGFLPEAEARLTPPGTP